mmetsp:Transcript_2869/g.5185  ORF Transcript_2869/g.5185 Transcript_2869/m.5185 type:complete len:136 (+) Transcript_2869:60-467(+)
MSDSSRSESGNSKSLENEELISLLEECDNYVKLHSELGKTLSNAFFMQTKSKKSGNTRMNLAENMREDFDAVYRVDAGGDGEFEEWKTKPTVDPITYISAMPNRDLKHSQESFKKALSLAVSLASEVNRLKSRIE